MAYTPLNRIQTDLYTPGGEYVIVGEVNPYVGYYHRYYNGRIFTGKSPQDEFIKQLTTYGQSDNTPLPGTTYPISEIQDPDPIIEQEYYNSQTVTNYQILKQKTSTAQRIPNTFIPKPTDTDYSLGEITRYFLKKTNEYKFIEVDWEVYNSFISSDSEYPWQFYLAIKLPWQISGKEEEVGKVNRNMVLLTEQRNKIRGLQEFLRFDYLKFYKS